MTPAARTEAAIYLLGKIADERRPADDIVRAWFQARRFVGSKDRRAIRERVYGVLRSLMRLDWHLENVNADTSARNRVLAAVVLDGEDEDTHFDGAKHSPTPLTDDEQAIADRLSGTSLDNPAQPDHVRTELPDWLADKLKPVYGDTFLNEAQALNTPAPMDLRVALGRVSRDQAQKALAKDGVKTTPTPLSPLGLRLEAHTDIGRTGAFRKGFVEVQDEGSQLLSLLVGAKAHMDVLDYCAGAGGKTLAIADRMGLTDGASTGALAAADIDAKRLARMDQRLKRAKLTGKIERVTLDGTESFGLYDRVLVDAPCSGSGTWRRHPEQKKRLTPERLNELMILQDQVLAKAAVLVKPAGPDVPGGRLIYATCSLLKEENEDRIDAFLKTHPVFQRIPIRQAWAEALKKAPCPEMASRDLRLTPARHGTDGFYVCVMERVS